MGSSGVIRGKIYMVILFMNETDRWVLLNFIFNVLELWYSAVIFALFSRAFFETLLSNTDF